MTENEMKHIVDMQHQMIDEYKALLKYTAQKDFEALDGLSKDLIIAEVNAVRTYLAIVGIRIGLNLNNLTQATSEVKEETPDITDESNDELEKAEE